MSDDFDWSSGECVVVHEQPPIAVYTNPHDAIVIRMNGDALQEYDQTVFVRPENVFTLIKALAREAGMGEVELMRKVSESPFSDTFETIETIEPGDAARAPLSNAERQRRYRQRHRNGKGDARVTENDELPLLIASNGQEVLQAAE